MKINNRTMTAEASRCLWDAELFCVFCVSVCIKYSWLWLCALARLSLFADGGNDTKVIRLSRTRPGKLHSSKHRILGLITLSPLSLFSEYRISPNKWQIVPDHWDRDGTIEHRSGVISPGYLWSHSSLFSGATGDEGDTAGLSPESDERCEESDRRQAETWSRQMDGAQSRPYVTHRGAGQQYSHCQKLCI